ncbi:helix-turn-helix domain-containing protein [Blastochloris tepida]|uniref:AraC family transcriptional regulator n=1 Tax=Blastochloris tepida TaxID=2233851 RepID=A0A348FXD0_9HYPH|nr:helix-turn-helix domain-containing protein [Blastochloris tepida]BBF91963.1 AraC family transcriptional regulator [Blastochloris tepida]
MTSHEEGRAGSDAPAHQSGPRLLRPYRFSTADLPPAERFDAWREHLRPVADLSPFDDARRLGAVDLAMWDLGTFALCQERNPGAVFERSAKRVRAAQADHWYLFLLKSGRNWTVSQGGAGERVSRGAASQLGLYSLGEACRGEMHDIETLMLFIPRDSFAAEAGHLDRASNTMLASPLGGLLADYLMALERRLPSLREEDLPAIAAATRAMITACLSPSRDGLREAESGMVIGLRERARRIVRARLGDRTLTPAALAQAMGVSRSVLYRLFEPQGGVARYIQHCRLAAASQALSDPNDTRRIHVIAEAFGFPNVQEFSRAFRSQFGFSPSEVRREMMEPGVLDLRRTRPHADAFGRSLRDFLSTTT